MNEPRPSDEDLALMELEALLRERAANARAGGLSTRTVQDILEQVLREHEDSTRRLKD